MKKKLFTLLGAGIFLSTLTLIDTTTPEARVSLHDPSFKKDLDNLLKCATEKNPVFLANVITGAINAYTKDVMKLLENKNHKEASKKRQSLFTLISFLFKNSKHFAPIYKHAEHEAIFNDALNKEIQKLYKKEYAAIDDPKASGELTKEYRSIIKKLDEEGIKGLSKIVTPSKAQKKANKKANKEKAAARKAENAKKHKEALARKKAKKHAAAVNAAKQRTQEDMTANNQQDNSANDDNGNNIPDDQQDDSQDDDDIDNTQSNDNPDDEQDDASNDDQGDDTTDDQQDDASNEDQDNDTSDDQQDDASNDDQDDDTSDDQQDDASNDDQDDDTSDDEQDDASNDDQDDEGSDEESSDDTENEDA